MGLMCSWIAVKGVSKADLLHAVGMVETDTPREAFPGCRDVNFSFRERPDGWIVLASEDFDWASHERILELSRIGPAVGCQFEDKVEMTSIATGAEDGAELWRVFHINEEKTPNRLDVSGAPPEAFANIREQMFREQEKRGGADYIHEIPLEVAKAVCGYRLDDEEEPFFALKPIGGEDEQADYGWKPGRRRRDKPEARPSLPQPDDLRPGFRYPARTAYSCSLNNWWPRPSRSLGWSWIAVKGAPLKKLLRTAGLKPRQPIVRTCPGGGVSHAYLITPDGWTVISCRRSAWASRKRIVRLSRFGPTVALQFNEGVGLESVATGAEQGVVLWRVYHSDDPRKPTLDVEGSPPPEFPEIRDGLFRKQEEAGGDASDIDHVHDVPIETAKAACNFYYFGNYDEFIALKPNTFARRFIEGWVSLEW